MVKAIPGQSEKPFAFPPESPFTFRPESRSPSARNRFHVHPGMAFTLARNPHLTDVGAPGNLPLAELLLEVQPENLFHFSHGLPPSGQRESALLGRTIVAGGFSPALPAPGRFSFQADQCFSRFDHLWPRAVKSDRFQRRTPIAFGGETLIDLGGESVIGIRGEWVID
jgi:hypothetical protein